MNEAALGDAAMGTAIIIANETLAGEALLGAVAVPATPIPHALAWEEDESLLAARERLRLILDWLRERGAEADGEIGDRDPVAAARDALRRRPADAVILSTLPTGRSRWIGQDVPGRLRAALRLPVQVITATGQPVEAPIG